MDEDVRIVYGWLILHGHACQHILYGQLKGLEMCAFFTTMFAELWMDGVAIRYFVAAEIRKAIEWGSKPRPHQPPRRAPLTTILLLHTYEYFLVNTLIESSDPSKVFWLFFAPFSGPWLHTLLVSRLDVVQDHFFPLKHLL